MARASEALRIKTPGSKSRLRLHIVFFSVKNNPPNASSAVAGASGLFPVRAYDPRCGIGCSLGENRWTLNPLYRRGKSIKSLPWNGALLLTQELLQFVLKALLKLCFFL